MRGRGTGLIKADINAKELVWWALDMLYEIREVAHVSIRPPMVATADALGVVKFRSI